MENGGEDALRDLALRLLSERYAERARKYRNCMWESCRRDFPSRYRCPKGLAW